MKILKSAIFIILLAFVACNNSPNNNINDDIVIEDEVKTDNPDELSIYTIPTPVLISNILKLYNIEYDSEILESNKNTENEQFSSLSMALNLGINLVDLSYSTVFEQTQYSIKYLNYIDNVLGKMNIRNYKTIFAVEKFRKNISDADSLTSMIIDFQNSLNKYYTSEKNDDVSLFIISGIYIEGLYISLHYHDNVIGNKFHNNNTLAAGYKNLILQQKAYLYNIDELLSKYKKEENNKLLDYYSQLKEQFELLDITYSTNKKTNKIENINYNRKEIEKLKVLTTEIREYIIKFS